MSEAPTNPQGEVKQPQLNMFDVMFGSEETTNPEQTIEEPVSTDSEEFEVAEDASYNQEELQAAEDDEEYDDAEYEVDDEEPQTATQQAYTVKVDGEEYEVTLDELQNGYQRQSDYTRKSQSLAEQRKAYEANLQAVQSERQQYSQVLEHMSSNQNLELKRFEKVDWKELKDSDPMEYMEKRLEYQEAKDNISEVNNERSRVQRQTQSEMKQALQQKVEAESVMLSSALPEYANPDSNLKDKVRNYALSLGFPEQEINSITDHRVVLVLHKAMLQDSNSKGLKKVKSAPKVVKSGTTQSKTQRVKKSVQAKRARLSKTGHAKDAANVFLDLIS
jgi:hypothetical protein|tara:strand:- start:4247 stop:5245 length:999 start_codon:yes stop_codon:yes gene_type:complete